MRTLVFILTFEAERHIREVLSRLPQQYINSPDTDILLIDDASHDRTASVARAWTVEQGWRNVTVLQNRHNQGYGGNQKVGYRYAIQRRYDVVVMLHGDAQYSPESLPLLLEPLQTDPTVDCVLGVRFGRRALPAQGRHAPL